MVKEIKVKDMRYYLNKKELINLKDQVDERLMQLRLEAVVKEIKTFEDCSTLTEYFQRRKKGKE